jgi:hypothetical protein
LGQCDHRNILTYSLDTPTCRYPFSGTANGSMIFIIGYMDPATEGATVTFDCPHEHILTGPNTTTCMGNGKWEPDPREVECSGMLQKSLASSDRHRSHAGQATCNLIH